MLKLVLGFLFVILLSTTSLLASVSSSFVGRWILSDQSYIFTVEANGNVSFRDTQTGAVYSGVAYEKSSRITMIASNPFISFYEVCSLGTTPILNCSWYGINYKGYGTETYKPISSVILPFIKKWIVTDSSYILNIASDGSVFFWDTVYGQKYPGYIIKASYTSISMYASNSLYAFIETCNLTFTKTNPQTIECSWYGTDGYSGSGIESYEDFLGIKFLAPDQIFNVSPGSMVNPPNYHSVKMFNNNRLLINSDFSLSLTDGGTLKGTYSSKQNELTSISKVTSASTFTMFLTNSDGTYFSRSNCNLLNNSPVKFYCKWLDTSNNTGSEMFNQLVVAQPTD